MKSKGYKSFFSQRASRRILFKDVLVWVIVSICFVTGIITFLQVFIN